ncbi:MAG: sporulation protein YqfD, partial [Oscillospiraceae bacterium]|nr:sporulation protein YqfD [Oscillospiraceae bacterium]
MMRYLRGSLEIELSGASPERCLNRWTQAEIAFWDYRQQETLQASCKIFRSDLAAAKREAARAQMSVRVLAEYGFPALLRRLRRRPVLVGGTLLSVALAIFLQ